MGPSLTQIIIIALVVILIFGTGKFPTMMENIAKGIKAFNKGLEGEAEKLASNKSPAKKSATKKATSKKTTTTKKTTKKAPAKKKAAAKK